MWDGTVQDFDSCHVSSGGTKQDRAEKDVLKLENNVLKQKKMFSKTGKGRS